MSLLSRMFGAHPVKLSQNLGAYPLPNGGISPLYVFFTVENVSAEEIEISSIRVSPKGEDVSLTADEMKGDVPIRLASEESVRFEVRARVLAGAARNAGHAGTPKLSFVATDGDGVEHRHVFALRVGEYLALKDE